MDDYLTRLCAAIEEDMKTQCNVMFCANDTHEGDWHSDVTGHSWTEETPAAPVIAHVYSMGEDEK